ncbi:MAG: hypothetical protein IJJ61_01585 [Clostridia bacterium]|nr:hypothetical protein [Clostridia bacterium]
MLFLFVQHRKLLHYPKIIVCPNDDLTNEDEWFTIDWPDTSKDIFDFFSDFERIKYALPNLADAIKKSFQENNVLVADINDYLKEKLKTGEFRFNIAKNGEILPTIRDSKTVVAQVRLKPMDLVDIGSSLAALSTNLALQKILKEISNLEKAVKSLHVEIRNDLLAEADGVLQNFEQAKMITDFEQRTTSLQSIGEQATTIKRKLLRDFNSKVQKLMDETNKKTNMWAYKPNIRNELHQLSFEAIEDISFILKMILISCEVCHINYEKEKYNTVVKQFADEIRDNDLIEKTMLMNEALPESKKQNKFTIDFCNTANKILSYNETKKIDCVYSNLGE